MAPAGRGHWAAVFARHGPGARNAARDRRHVRRTVRLAVALGLAGAALCLLLAMLAIVVSMGGAGVPGAAPALVLATDSAARTQAAPVRPTSQITPDKSR